MKRVLRYLGPIVALALWQNAGAKEIKVASNPYQLKLPASTDYKLINNARLAPYRATASATEEIKAYDDKPYAKHIEEQSRENGLDPALVHALIHVESRYRPDAVSAKGAVGLMQVLPATAQRFGIADPSAPEANLKAGTRYLRALLNRFEDRLELAIAAYNAGEAAVERYGNEIPPYPETRAYVPAVLEKYKELAGQKQNPNEQTYLPGTRLDPKAINKP